MVLLLHQQFPHACTFSVHTLTQVASGPESLSMAASSLQLNYGLIDQNLSAHTPPTSASYLKNNVLLVQRIPENGAFGALSPQAAMWCKSSQAYYGEHGMAPDVMKLCANGQVTESVDSLHLLVHRGSQVPVNLFYCVLKRCTAQKDLVLGRRIHGLTVKSGYEGNAFLATHLIGMYASHGMLEEAMLVFSSVPAPDAYNWSSIIIAYARHADPTQAIRLYRQMRASAVKPGNRTFVAVLKACATAGDLAAGKSVHADILESVEKPDVFVQTCLVDMYAKCGNLQDARRVFDRLQQKNVVTWTAMIAGYSKHGMGQEAFSVYVAMQREGITQPNSVTFVCLLEACASLGVVALHQGRKLHAQIEEQGLQHDVAVGAGLVNMYANVGSIETAQKVFDSLSQNDVVIWTGMTAGYAQQGMLPKAPRMYSSPKNKGTTPVGYVCLLQACASVGLVALQRGKQLHAQIQVQGLEDDVVVGGSLVNMYVKCGCLENAQKVFDRLSRKNVVTWTALIAGYVQEGLGQKALSLYSRMQLEGITLPDSVTYVCLLQACASIGAVAFHQGKQMHAQIEEQGLQDDVVVNASLVNMYAKCGSIEDACRVFDGCSHKNVVTWNAMIAGYAHQGLCQEALSVYNRMQQEGVTPPNSVTFVSLLQACASVGIESVHHGKQLHGQIEARGLQDDVTVGSSLVNMYAKCGSVEDAQKVFDSLSQKNVFTWTAMIAGYSQRGRGQEALTLYSSMQKEGLTPPDPVTYVCLLQACAAVAALPLGEQLHAHIEERAFQGHVAVGSSLVNMYAKCGSMEEAQQVFNSLVLRDIVAWNALIAGYTRLGDSAVVFDLVDTMQQEGIHPNSITFLSVLTVCSHGGLVDKGRKYFVSMSSDYGIGPTIEHCTCMMDLLGRAGHLEEALWMAKTMPFPPNGRVWPTLLGACRKWRNVEIGRQAFEFAVSIDDKDAASYVLMSNIYAGAQMWEEAKEMQARRKRLGAWKEPGQSWWTDLDGVVHSFVVADKNHPESEGIYARLELLLPKMKKEGYVPNLGSSLRDLSDDEKEAELCGHSEKLAIAYALNNTSEGTAIRVVKNLRVCVDCHTATAYISKIEKRTIICRDANRFHVYKVGQCSCGDYW